MRVHFNLKLTRSRHLEFMVNQDDAASMRHTDHPGRSHFRFRHTTRALISDSEEPSSPKESRQNSLLLQRQNVFLTLLCPLTHKPFTGDGSQ